VAGYRACLLFVRVHMRLAVFDWFDLIWGAILVVTMKNIISRANSSLTVGKAAWILSGSFAVSAVLGLLREKLLIAKFGLGPTLDAYIIAFSIPDFMFYLLVSGALSVTLIPVLSQRLQTGNKESAWQISASLMNLFAIGTAITSIVIFIFAPPLVKLIAAGSPKEVQDTAANLMRIIAVNPFLFSISSVLASMQQAFGRFFFNSLAPVVYNIGIITGIVWFAPAIGTQDNPAIVGVALGVGLGAILQLIIQTIGLAGLGFKYDRKIFWRNRGFRKVLKLLPARSLDQSIDYLNSIVERFLASFLVVGSIAAYNTAYVLRSVPITLIGVAISTAAFPKISARAASKRTDLFRKDIESVFNVLLWLSIPAAAIAFFMRGYLVRFLVGQGNTLIVSILGWFTLSIIFRALFQAATRAFYAQQDTSTPLKISVYSILLNIGLAVVFVNLYDVVGLAMAQTAVAIFEVLFLVIVLTKRIGTVFTKESFISTSKMLVAVFGMSVVNYVFVRYIFPLKAGDVGFFALAPKFGVIVVVTLASYVFFSHLLKIKESQPVVKGFLKLLYKPLKIHQP